MARSIELPRLLCFVLFALVLIAVFATPSAYAQQTYITKYDAFVGYTYFNSPSISLNQKGVHLQVGMRQRKWYSLGFDYSNAVGDMTLTPELLPDALQATLSGQLRALAAAGRLPAGYALAVKADARTQTFAAGPQLAYRGWKALTPFIRPSMGAIYEVATPKPSDPIATAIVNGLAPEGKKHDWQGFYGVGGGFDVNFSKHYAVRIQADWVYDHLFDDLLKNGRQTVRFSVGPAFNFGRNIAQ